MAKSEILTGKKSKKQMAEEILAKSKEEERRKAKKRREEEDDDDDEEEEDEEEEESEEETEDEDDDDDDEERTLEEEEKLLAKLEREDAKDKKSKTRNESKREGKKERKKKEKKPVRERDEFGSYEGSGAWYINACITRVPRSAKEIIEEANDLAGDGARGAGRNHLDRLVRDGLIKKTAEGKFRRLKPKKIDDE